MTRRHILHLAPNECALIKTEGNKTVIEVMRFLTLGAAKSRRLRPNRRGGPRVNPPSIPSDWKTKARHGSKSLLDAIQRTGLEP